LIRTPKKSAPKRTRKTKSKTKKSKTPKLYIIAAVAVILLALISIILASVHMIQKPPAVTISNQTQPLQPTTPNITILPDLPDENTTQLPIVVPPKIETKPKLVIIIDDVTFPKQVEKILSIPLSLSPSFLPPKPETPFSDKLAEDCEFYMVHLPLEALNFKRPEKTTLLTSDSYDVILEKLKSLKAQFPRAIYYNNHTGSKFTADIDAMRRLINAMDELDLIFVDSRTTAETKAPEIFAEQGRKLLQRDVFLDNEIEEEAIKTQLLIAVKKAKEKGFAIAIGHPHDKTLDTIAKSLNILKDVEVVYLKDL
jgi:polysaccharide deacetylase 2 family uncharacterized protein YibQ